MENGLAKRKQCILVIVGFYILAGVNAIALLFFGPCNTH